MFVNQGCHLLKVFFTRFVQKCTQYFLKIFFHGNASHALFNYQTIVQEPNQDQTIFYFLSALKIRTGSWVSLAIFSDRLP